MVRKIYLISLAEYLTGIFHAKGYVIHGGTPVKRRTEIVEKFQGERYVPFIVLSVKAAGTGLNLTKANHVIHFDRWWNPAVENQATDRAFRIGQTKDVMVHKFVSKGTIEEKIDAIINSKGVPKCSCGGRIKPDVVLYEEGLDEKNIQEAVRLIKEADVLIVGGTSLGVYPAAGLIDYYNGNKLVLINKSETPYDRRADLLIHDALGNVFSQI